MTVRKGCARSLDRASLIDTIPAMYYREGQWMVVLSIVSDSEIDHIDGLHDAWRRLVRTACGLNVIYQSPDWWECTIRPEAADAHRIAVLRDEQGAIVGVVPFQMGEFPLDYGAGSHTFWRHQFRSLRILGGEPLVPPNAECYRVLVEGMLDAFPDCDAVVVDPLECNSPAWLAIHGEAVSGRVVPYLPYGRRLAYEIKFPASYEEYFARFKKKSRQNLERQMRRLRDHGGGRLELVRIDRPDQIREYLDQAEEVSRHTWQEREVGKRINKADAAKFERLAARGIFRSYVLHCGGVPCAFGKGLLFQSAFQYLQTGYDERLARLSPGTAMLLMMLEDLIEHGRAERFNFSYGSWWYKEWFSRCEIQEACLLLLRRDWGNRLRTGGHAMLRSSVSVARRMLRRPCPADQVAGT